MKLSQLENIVAATEALQRSLKGITSLSGLEIDDCLKAANDRAVFKGRLGEDKVVVKVSLGKTSAETVTMQAEELRFHADRMLHGPYRVPELIAALPERGLILMQYVPGLRLIDAMKQRNGGDRVALTAMAGRWLGYLTALRRRKVPLAAGYWSRRIAEDAARSINTENRALLSLLADWMEERLPRLKSAKVTQVRGHGDFCPLNLIVDDEVMYGVDLQSNRWFALERDLARFLVVSRIGHGDTTEQWFGVAADEAKALISAPGLIGADEAAALIPFFLASEMSARLVSESHKESTRLKLHRMINDFLQFPDEF